MSDWLLEVTSIYVENMGEDMIGPMMVRCEGCIVHFWPYRHHCFMHLCVASLYRI